MTAFAAFATYQWGAAVLARNAAVIAERDAVRSREQAESNLAANLYNQSIRESENQHDSARALLYACQAANAAPRREQQSTYLDRVVHLATAAPLDVKALHVGEPVAEASFSPDGRRVARS